jgi:uroporphyrinogen-III synthase
VDHVKVGLLSKNKHRRNRLLQGTMIQNNAAGKIVLHTMLLHGLSSVAHHRPTPIHLAVTRETGKNDKLRNAIRKLDLPNEQNVSIHELPCIEHATGADFDRFEQLLYDDTTDPWDYVIVTSPEAASVLRQVWDNSASLQPPVAAVGAATAIHLKQSGIPVAFLPSRATAADLARELPSCRRVLYAASAQAPDTLQTGLAQRHIHTERLNTYDTIQATWDEQAMVTAARCSIVCLASPSAAKGWVANTEHRPTVAVCIGKTTADACAELGGFKAIRYPECPGMDGWVQLVQEAVLEQQQQEEMHESPTSSSSITRSSRIS